jgi:acyl-coenzyme A synthetase/AMP-(fatty) acid ligase
MCYNALDRHVEAGFGDNVAFIYDSVYLNITENWTYSTILNRVGRLANILKKKFNV